MGRRPLHFATGMQLISLDQVFRILKPGVPLPWGVRDAAGQLLLAKGHVLHDQAHLTELLNRGMYVDAEDVKRSGGGQGESEAVTRPVEKFSMRWDALQRKLGLLLRAPGEPDFLKQACDVAAQIGAFSDGHADEIIFLIVRHDRSQHAHYPAAHAMHVAALCHLVSRRLNWPESRRQSGIGAALTMNLAITSLQAQLAGQRSPLSPLQRGEIDAHPLASAALLRSAGLQDEEWLSAVEQHHESPDGVGYPRKLQAPTEMSQLLRLADSFAAKHSARAGRSALPPHQAAKNLYAQSGGHPLAAALIKECGIYPPGCYVKLASGETAVVTRRGETAKEPLVAAITNARGEPLARPVQRDTSLSTRAIVGTLEDTAVKVHVSADQLYEHS